jgi:hypothetical protein
MKYNVVEFIRNTRNQYVTKIASTQDSLDGAAVRYHQDLAAFHNASDVLVATVKIEDEFGHEVNGFFEVVDHRPEPEPEVERVIK